MLFKVSPEVYTKMSTLTSSELRDILEESEWYDAIVNESEFLGVNEDHAFVYRFSYYDEDFGDDIITKLFVTQKEDGTLFADF